MAVERADSPTKTPDQLRTSEIPLAGKTAIVTGGSRDVGRGIVEQLAREGVNVVFSFRNKQKRANEVLDSVRDFDGKVEAIAADISTPEGRDEFFTSALEILGGNVDFLILSTSGPTKELNTEASMDFLDKVLPHMKNGGTAIRMNSVPGHFMPQLKGSFSLKEYDEVARNKYPDIKSLRERMPEMMSQGIRFVEVCPTIVTGTNNLKFALRIDPTAIEQHDLVSDMLGVPRAVSPDQVGEKIAEILKNPEIRSGHTEFFNGLIDAQTSLEELYREHVYVNTFEMDGRIGGTRYGSGRAIVTLDQATRQNEPPMIDKIRRMENGGYIGILAVGKEHVGGYFPGESNQPLVFPEHKQIRAAIETIGMIMRAQGRTTEDVRLAGFERAEFYKPVIINGNSKIDIVPRRNEDGTYNVEILGKDGNHRFALIEGLRLRLADESEKDNLLEDQMLAGAFQSTLVLSNGNLHNRNWPLILEFGKTEFTEAGVTKGEGIKYDVALGSQHEQGREEAAIFISSQGRKLASVNGLRMF